MALAAFGLNRRNGTYNRGGHGLSCFDGSLTRHAGYKLVDIGRPMADLRRYSLPFSTKAGFFDITKRLGRGSVFR